VPREASARVSVRAGGKTDITDANGKYSCSFRMGLLGQSHTSGHRLRSGLDGCRAQGSNVTGVDFQTCASSQKSLREPAAAGRASKGPFCRLFAVDLKPAPTKNAELEKVPSSSGTRGKDGIRRAVRSSSRGPERHQRSSGGGEVLGKILRLIGQSVARKAVSGIVSATQAGVTKWRVLMMRPAAVAVFADKMTKVLFAAAHAANGELFVRS